MYKYTLYDEDNKPITTKPLAQSCINVKLTEHYIEQEYKRLFGLTVRAVIGEDSDE